MKRFFLKTLVAAVAVAAFGVAQAQTKTIKFANQNAKGHPIVMGMEKFAEIVEAKSGGKLKVDSDRRFPLTLRFERAGEREVMVWVQQPRDAAGAPEHRH